MTFRFKRQAGFSLIELMVVMAIMGAVMALTGALMQRNIEQQERIVELEKLNQLFQELGYSAYYTGSTFNVVFEENRVVIKAQSRELEFSRNVDVELTEKRERMLEFSHLTFVAQEFIVSPRGTISPNSYSILSAAGVTRFPLNTVFTQNEVE